jgi:hypothetical protein
MLRNSKVTITGEDNYIQLTFTEIYDSDAYRRYNPLGPKGKTKILRIEISDELPHAWHNQTRRCRSCGCLGACQ